VRIFGGRQRTELPVPAGLERAILMALSKNPDDRPASMREFAAILGDGLPGDWSGGEALEWWRLHEPELAAQS